MHCVLSRIGRPVWHDQNPLLDTLITNNAVYTSRQPSIVVCTCSCAKHYLSPSLAGQRRGQDTLSAHARGCCERRSSSTCGMPCDVLCPVMYSRGMVGLGVGA